MSRVDALSFQSITRPMILLMTILLTSSCSIDRRMTSEPSRGGVEGPADASFILVTRIVGRQLDQVLIDYDAKDTRPIPEELMIEGWSPDGTHLLSVGVDRTVMVKSPASADPVVVDPNSEEREIADIAWLDNEVVLILWESANASLEVIDIDTGERNTFPNTPGDLIHAISPDGRWWIESNPDLGLTEVVYPDGSSRRFAPHVDPQSSQIRAPRLAPGIQILPDAEHAVLPSCRVEDDFVTIHCDLMLARLENGVFVDQKKVLGLPTGSTIQSFRLSPDGHHLIISDNQKSLYLLVDVETWELEATYPWPNHTYEPWYYWSPESSHVAIFHQHNGSGIISALDIDTGELSTVYEEADANFLPVDWKITSVLP